VADSSLIFNVFAKFHGDDTKMDKFGKAAAVVGVAAGALAIKFGKDSVTAYVDAQQSQDKLQFALSKFPKLADTNVERLGKLNSELAKKTRFDDDATASGQAVLGQFVDTGRQLEDLTPLMQDFAAKTGRDLPTAAGLMGKAFLGNTRALKDLGINYKATGDKTKDMANITRLMRERVGGFAAKEGKSAAGQAEILSNQFGEVQESVGARLVPVLLDLASVLISVIGFMQTNATTMKIAAGVVAALALGIGALVAISKIQLFVTAAQTAGTVQYAVAQKVAAIGTGIATAAQWLWNAALTAGAIAMQVLLSPITLIIAAIALLVVGIILAYKHSETFRDIVQAAMKGVVTAFQWVIDAAQKVFGWVKSNWPLILGFLTGPFGLAFAWILTHWGTFKDIVGGWKDAIASRISDLFGGIRDAFTGARDWVLDRWAAFKERVSGFKLNFSGLFDGIWQAFRAAINLVIRGWNSLQFMIPSINTHIPGVGTVGGMTVGTPNIPYLAAGGIVTRPTLAMLGEGGPEAVVPLRGAMAGGAPTNIYVTVNAPVGSNPKVIGEEIYQALLAFRNGRGPLTALTS